MLFLNFFISGLDLLYMMCNLKIWSYFLENQVRHVRKVNI